MGNVDGVITLDAYNVARIKFDNFIDFDVDEERNIVPRFRRTIHYNEVENTYLVSLEFQMSIENDTNDPPFLLEIEIRGEYSSDIQDRDQVIRLVSENGIAILFPYLRALVSTITANANLPMFILPTMNIVELFKAQDGKNDADSDASEE